MSTAISTGIVDHLPPGTDESAWQRALAHIPEWMPPDGPLLIVSPHPDNEVQGAGGLVHTWKNLGRAVTILSVTDGEAAYHPQWKLLGQIRRDELKAALQVLSGHPVLVVRLGIPDGRVADHVGRLRSAILSVMDPDTTILAPYEDDGHPDHDAAGRVCVELARTHGIKLARYPIWAWRHGTPRLSAAKWGRFTLSKAAQAAKESALLCFSSQLSPYKRIPIVTNHVMAYFTRPYEAFML